MAGMLHVMTILMVKLPWRGGLLRAMIVGNTITLGCLIIITHHRLRLHQVWNCLLRLPGMYWRGLSIRIGPVQINTMRTKTLSCILTLIRTLTRRRRRRRIQTFPIALQYRVSTGWETQCQCRFIHLRIREMQTQMILDTPTACLLSHKCRYKNAKVQGPTLTLKPVPQTFQKKRTWLVDDLRRNLMRNPLEHQQEGRKGKRVCGTILSRCTGC